jgi:hypothetical protein
LRLTFAIFLMLCLLGQGKAAHAKDQVFYPHLSTPANTAGSGELTFDPFPGSNGLQSPLLNALDIGLGSRLDVGVAPIFYALPGHSYNANAKLNFLKLNYLYLAAGASAFSFHFSANPPIAETNGATSNSIDFQLYYGVLAANLFLPGTPFALGLNIYRSKFHSSSPSLNDSLNSNAHPEWFVDLAIAGRNWALTPGFGALRLYTMMPQTSPVPFGFGATITWIHPALRIFRELAVGLHHMQSVHKNSVLFSFAL